MCVCFIQITWYLHVKFMKTTLTTGTCTPSATSVMEVVPSKKASEESNTFTKLSTVVNFVTVMSTSDCLTEECALPTAVWMGVSVLFIFLTLILTVIGTVLCCALYFRKQTTKVREIQIGDNYTPHGTYACSQLKNTFIYT